MGLPTTINLNKNTGTLPKDISLVGDGFVGSPSPGSKVLPNLSENIGKYGEFNNLKPYGLDYGLMSGFLRDDIRHSNQSNWDVLGNASMHFAGSALNAALEIPAIFYGALKVPFVQIDALSQGKSALNAAGEGLSQIYDNEISREVVDPINQWFQDTFKVYQSQAQKDSNFFSYENLASGHFLDALLSGVGYTAGSFLTGAALTKAFNLGKAASVGTKFKDAEAAVQAASKGINTISPNLKAQLTLGTIMATMESSLEARQTKDQILETLKDRNDLSDAQKEEIANSGSLANFAFNMAVLVPTNTFIFKNLIRPGANDVEAGLKTVFKDGKLIEDAGSKYAKAFRKVKNPITESIVTEGGQEYLQFASNAAINDYLDTKYNGNNANIFDSIGKALYDGLTTKEGLESTVIGGLIGGGAGTLGHFRNAKSDAERKKFQLDFANKMLPQLNEVMKNKLLETDRTLTYQQLADDNITNRDKFNYFNDRHSSIVSLVQQNLQAGTLGILIDRINSLRNASAEELNQVFGNDITTADTQRWDSNDTINSLIKEINNIKKVNDAVQLNLPNPYDQKKDTAKFLAFRELQNLATHTASSLDNTNNRILKINADLNSFGVSFNNIYFNTLDKKGKEEYIEATNQEIKDTNPVHHKHLTESVNDIIKLNKRKEIYTKAYNDLTSEKGIKENLEKIEAKQNPPKPEEKPKEKPPVPPTPPQPPVVTDTFDITIEKQGVLGEKIKVKVNPQGVWEDEKGNTYTEENGYYEPGKTNINKGAKQVLYGENHFTRMWFQGYASNRGFSAKTKELINKIAKLPNWKDYVSIKVNKSQVNANLEEEKKNGQRTLFGNKEIKLQGRYDIDILLDITDPETGEVPEEGRNVTGINNPNLFVDKEGITIDFNDTKWTLTEFNRVFSNYDEKLGSKPFTQPELDTFKANWNALKEFNDDLVKWFSTQNLPEVPLPKGAVDFDLSGEVSWIPKDETPVDLDSTLFGDAFKDSPIVSEVSRTQSINGKDMTGIPFLSDQEYEFHKDTRFRKSFFVFAKLINGLGRWLPIQAKPIPSTDFLQNIKDIKAKIDANPNITREQADLITNDINFWIASLPGDVIKFVHNDKAGNKMQLALGYGTGNKITNRTILPDITNWTEVDLINFINASIKNKIKEIDENSFRQSINPTSASIDQFSIRVNPEVLSNYTLLFKFDPKVLNQETIVHESLTEVKTEQSTTGITEFFSGGVGMSFYNDLFDALNGKDNAVAKAEKALLSKLNSPFSKGLIKNSQDIKDYLAKIADIERNRKKDLDIALEDVINLRNSKTVGEAQQSIIKATQESSLPKAIDTAGMILGQSQGAFAAKDMVGVAKKLADAIEKIQKVAIDKINAKYDAEIAALEQKQPTSNQSEIEVKKADIERRKQALRDLMKATGDDIFMLGVEDGTFMGESLLNMNENGDVVLTRYADSEEGLTKGKGKTKNLKDIAGQFGGEQIATSGIEGGAASFTNRVVGEYHIPLQELIDLIKSEDVVFAGLGNKEFVLSPHIADKYLTKINGKQINAKYDAELAALENKIINEEPEVNTEDNSINSKKTNIERRRQEELKISAWFLSPGGRVDLGGVSIENNKVNLYDFLLHAVPNELNNIKQDIITLIKSKARKVFDVIDYKEIENSAEINAFLRYFDISKINAKYDAELATLNNQTTPQTSIEVKKADIEKNRRRDLNITKEKTPKLFLQNALDKINAKYDAEIAALESKSESKYSPELQEEIDNLIVAGYSQEDIEELLRSNKNFNKTKIYTDESQLSSEPRTYDEIRARLLSQIPNGISIERIERVLDQLNVIGIPVGFYRDNAVYISEKMGYLDVDHEAFHAVFSTVLSPQEQERYLKAKSKELNYSPEQLNSEVQDLLSKRPDLIKLLKDKIISRKDVENLVIEEKLSDEYADKRNNKELNQPKPWKNIIFDLFDAIVNFFTGNVKTIDLFNKIDRGAFVNSSINKSNPISPFIKAKLVGGLSAEESRNLIALITAKASSLDNTKSINTIINDLIEEYNPLSKPNLALINSKTSEFEKSKLRKLFIKYNFGIKNNKALVQSEAEKYLKYLRYNPITEEEENFDTDVDKDMKEYDRLDSEVNTLDRVSSEIKTFIASSIYTVNFYGKEIETAVNFPRVYNQLLSILTNQDANKVLGTIKALGTKNPEINALYNKLNTEKKYSKETPQGITFQDEMFLTRFVNQFKLARLPYVTVFTQDKKVLVKKTNKHDAGTYRFDEWSTNYSLVIDDKLLQDEKFRKDLQYNLENLVPFLENKPVSDKWVVDGSNVIKGNLHKSTVVKKIFNSLGIELEESYLEVMFDNTDEDSLVLRELIKNEQGDITSADLIKLQDILFKNTGNSKESTEIRNPFLDSNLSGRLLAIANANAQFSKNFIIPNYRASDNTNRYTYVPYSSYSQLLKELSEKYETLQNIKASTKKGEYLEFNNFLFGDNTDLIKGRFQNLEIFYIGDNSFEEGKTYKDSDAQDVLRVLHGLFQNRDKNGYYITAPSIIGDKRSFYGVTVPFRNMYEEGKISADGIQALKNLFTQEYKRLQGDYGKVTVPIWLYLPVINNHPEIFEKIKTQADINTHFESVVLPIIQTDILSQMQKHSVKGMEFTEEYLYQFFLNNLINNSAVQQLTEGDLSQLKYKDLGTWEKSYNALFSERFKRESSLNASGKDMGEGIDKIIYTEDTEAWVNIESGEVQWTKPEGEEAKKFYKKPIDPDDAQVFQSPRGKFKDLKALGTLTELQKLALKKLNGEELDAEGNPVPLTKEEIQSLDLVSQKHVTAGFDTLGNRVYYKMSIYTLTPWDTGYWDSKEKAWKPKRGQEQGFNRWKLLQDNNADLLVPKSAAKIFFGKSTPITGENPTIYEVPRKYRREQVLKESKDKTRVPWLTQIQQLIDFGLLDNEVNNLLKEEIQDIQVQLRNNTFDFLSSQLADAQGNLKEDISYFLQKLRDTVEESTPDMQMIELLKDTYGSIDYTLNFAHTRKKLEQIYLSHFKDAFQHKLGGAKLTMVSPIVYRAIRDENGEVIPSSQRDSDEYNDYPISDLRVTWENGNPVGEIVISGYTAKRLGLKIGDTIVSLRVPTQGYNFMGRSKIVDILPDYQGDIVIAAPQLTLYAGQDFDDDSLFIFSKERHGKQYYGDATEIEDKWEEYRDWYLNNNLDVKKELSKTLTEEGYDKILKEVQELKLQRFYIKKFQDPSDTLLDPSDEYNWLFKLSNRELKEALQKRYEDIKDLRDYAARQVLEKFNLPGTLEDFILKGSPESQGALNNRLINKLEEVMQKEELEKYFKQASTTDDTKASKEKIEKILGTDKITYNIFTPDGLIKAWDDNTASTTLRGSAVLAQSTGANLTKNRVDLNPEFYIQFNGETYKTFNTPDDVTYLKNNYSSEKVSTTIDNSKDPMASTFHWLVGSVSIFSYLNQLGINIKDGDAPLSVQPVIVKAGSLKPRELAPLLNDYISKLKNKEVPNNLTSKELWDALEMDQNSQEFLQIQVKALRLYIKAQQISSFAFNVSRLNTLTRIIGSSFDTARSFLNSYDELTIPKEDSKGNPIPNPFDTVKLLQNEKNIVNNVRNLHKVLDIARNLFLQETEMFRNIQNETLSLLKGSTFKNTPKVRANLSTYLQMKVYKALNPNVKFAGLITELKDTKTEDLITTKFKNLLKYPEFKQNKFIKYLKPLSPGEKGNTTPLHILKFDSTTTPTKELSEVFIDSINQMYHSANPEIAQFATDLLNYQAAMNNMEFGNNSFMRFIPVQMLRKLAQNLQKLNTELAKSNPSESVIKELTGKTSAELQNEFIRNYISNSNNYRSQVNTNSLPKEYKPVHEYRFSTTLYGNEHLKPWLNTPEGNKALSDYLSTKYKDIQGDPEPNINEEEIPEDRFEISPEDQETIVLSPEIIQGIEGSELVSNIITTSNNLVNISTQDYTKSTPDNKSNGFFFTENLQAYLANRNRGDELPGELPFNVQPKLDVTANNNQAGIRYNSKGQKNENAFAIISKKFQQNTTGGSFVKEEGQFKDTDKDFELFKKYNTEAIQEAKNSNLPLVISEKGVATGKSALPLRFVEWLNNYLKEELGVYGDIKENTQQGYKGYGIFNLKNSEVLESQEKVVSLPEKMQIDFQEEQSLGYKARTVKNASADVTIAFAADFNTPGEKLTKSTVLQQGKKYIKFDIATIKQSDFVNPKDIVKALNEANASSINIAGNGIYTLKNYNWTQDQLDTYIYELLRDVINDKNLKNPIKLIRTGGQTGVDEAGAKAGLKLGIPTIVLAPKGWMFRDINNKDISNEEQFKARFKIGNEENDNIPDCVVI